MTAKEVLKRIGALKKIADDDEAAHNVEDQLYTAVLTAIAAGSGDAQALAKAALKSKLVSFHRWCA